jgi:hypothetical protein
VSGEPVVLLRGEAMTRLVRAASRLAGATLGRYAVIGGVAVSARLQQAHRATADLDAVVDDSTPPPAVDALLALPGAQPDPTGEHRVLIEGVKIEIQGTEPLDAERLVGLSDKQILYVTSHRYALDSAAPVILVAETDGTRATIPVATAGALIAMKLHAIEDRRTGASPEKRASDAWDMYRLLLDLDARGAVRDELAQAPEALRGVALAAAERVFVTRAARTISWLKSGDDGMSTVHSAELTAVGRPLVDALRAAT